MILIADSGSTKTDWVLCDNGVEVKRVFTDGFNPYYQPSSDMENIADKLVESVETDSVEEIYFYGSGCSAEGRKQIVVDVLKSRFPLAVKIEVEHDMLAAARALCGKEAGIACILGTGMNCCKYDGTKITDNLNSLGFMFADEGSGSDLGKSLLAAHFKGKLSSEMSRKFDAQFGITLEEMLSRVYGGSGVGKYMASFSPFVLSNIEEPSVRKIAIECFKAFFEENVLIYDGYRDLPCNMLGSIAVYYKEVIEEVAKEYGVRLGKVMRTPIDGLVEYHCHNYLILNT